jgi:alanine racemase
MATTENAAAFADAELTVDLDAIAANWRALRARHLSGAVAAVVKADGYGCGARAVSARLYAEGCRHFFVATLAEAMAIRPALPDALVAALNGPPPGSADTHAAHAITPVLRSLDDIAAWGARGPAILHLDTGLSRTGLPPGDVAAVRGLDMLFAMTHLVASEVPDDPMNARQRQLFADLCDTLRPRGRSLANSSGLFLGPDFGSDLARPGAALYGINPTLGRPNPMRQAVRLRARVVQIRTVPAGASVGYNATWTAPRTTRIATVGIGYADGWRRSLSNRGAAGFDGRALPLVGRVSMDLTTYDATEAPGLRAGDWLELIGPDPRDGRTPDDVAEAAGTNAYEVLTALGPRIARAYRPA